MIAIADIHLAVVGERGAMHDLEVLVVRHRLRRIVGNVRRLILRWLAVRAPHSLELPCRGVDDDYSPVPVAVGHIDFVRRIVNADFSRVGEILGVLVPLARAVLADLEQEFAVFRELQNRVAAVAGKPHVVFRVDGHAVHRRRPLEAGAFAAPMSDQVAVGVELKHRWRLHAAEL